MQKLWRHHAIGNRLLATAAKPASEAKSLKPFESIPSLPRGIPIIGNVHHLFSKPYGRERSADNFREIERKYDPDGVGMVRMDSLVINPGEGKGRVVLVCDADVVEQVFRYGMKQFEHASNYKIICYCLLEMKANTQTEEMGLPQ